MEGKVKDVKLLFLLDGFRRRNSRHGAIIPVKHRQRCRVPPFFFCFGNALFTSAVLSLCVFETGLRSVDNPESPGLGALHSRSEDTTHAKPYAE